MDKIQNQQIRLASRPVGEPTSANWNKTIEEIPSLEAGDVLVKVEYISLDPAMRGWMNAARSYIRPVEIGEVMRAGGCGKVIDSKNEKFAIGDYVTGSPGVQNYWLIKGGKGALKVNTNIAPATTWLGALGMVGMTAYFGLFDVCAPKPTDVVVVSGGAGAVGSLVGQMAKIHGCTVVGIAGGEEKTALMRDTFGFDAVVDYKKGNLRSQLRAACPEGIDVYFDNVGGEILDTCLSMLRLKARIAICGAISAYNATEMVGPKNYLSLLVNRARMEGFVVFDYAPRYQEAVTQMAQWIHEGKLKTIETVVDGDIDSFHETFMQLFKGENMGKLMLKITE